MPKINLEMIRLFAAELAQYQEDPDTYLDTLDGETDVLDALDRAIFQVQHDGTLTDAITAMMADLESRRERITMRKEATRRFIGVLLGAAGMHKAERPGATVSVRPGNLSVRITDERDIPSQLMRVKTTSAPDKTAIKARLEAGETIPGAELVRGDDIVTVRVK